MKQVQVFLTKSDEMRLTSMLKKERPSLRFLDGSLWDGNEPVSCDSIEACTASSVYVWDPLIVPDLPCGRRSNGWLEGPTAGVVIQLTRSQCQGDILLSGSAAEGGFLESFRAELKLMSDLFWKTLRTVSKANLVGVDVSDRSVIWDKVTQYRVGGDAEFWVRSGTARLLKDRSTPTYFLPKDLAKSNS